MNRQKKRRAFFTHIFSTLWDHRGARSSFSLPFVYLLSSSRRRLFPTTPANQVSENGRNTAPLLLALRSAAHRTARVFSLSREREREGIRLVRNAVFAFPHLYSGRDESSFCKIAGAFVQLNHRPPPLYS